MIKTNPVFISMSDRMSAMLHIVKQFEITYLDMDKAVVEPYRWLGIHRLLSSPEMGLFGFTWFVQMVIETEIDRDQINISSEEDLNNYKNHFFNKLKEHSPTDELNKYLIHEIELGFNNIYDSMGFNDEE